MKKRNLITALTVGTAIALAFAVAGCGKKSEKTSDDVKVTESTTVYEETTTTENGSQPEEETKADTGDKILDELIDAGYDENTEYETDDNGTIFIVEDGKKTEVETDKDANIVPVKDNGKADKETKPEKETKNDNKADDSNKTDNKPAANKPASKPATPKSITAKVSGTHYVGDTLSGSDFTVTVTMSDGSTLTNPAGWSASPLKLSAESNKITVSYSSISSTITVKASKKAAAKPAENKPAAPAKTYSSDYEKHFIENGGKYKTNSDGTVTIISGGIDGSGKLMIPAKIDGKRVKNIDENVVKYTSKWGDNYLSTYCYSNGDSSGYKGRESGKKLTSLYIEEGSTMDLGQNTFSGLNYCTYVYIPKSITKIPESGWLNLYHPVQKCKVIVNHPVETWPYGYIAVDDVMDGSDRCAVWLDVVYSN